MHYPKFVNMEATTDDITSGLGALADVQSIVSSLVKDAIPVGNAPPPPVAVLTYGFALIVEVVELMNELGWKPWKPRKPINVERVMDEFADVLAFLGLFIIYAMRLAGVGAADLATAYMRKSDVNVARFTGAVPEYAQPPEVKA